VSAKNPDECRFTKSHEWLATDGTVGLSDHAQKEITDVVFVELPKVGREFKAGEAVAVVESVKAAFDIYAPVSGKVTKVNNDVVKNPALVNQSPYGNGWLFNIEKSNPTEEKNLMTHTDYRKFVESEEH
jgi:glycine cleavage system H protein